jgi:nucleotide-binding universal stress UspA family protein
MNTTGRNSHVVVGADGSPASYAALRWAVRHAPLIGATVDVAAGYDRGVCADDERRAVTAGMTPPARTADRWRSVSRWVTR